ncbi:glutamate synthase [Listeria floridensis FSL S10-1187]|uniref:Glutamate synthase n=1 Tax=Listeria floridensis FSL S10-1187 TaxID=1265817 RepID=A0ABN0RDF9_9LIST|nr:glutamate synthase [Listeria floridensis FSL S10-1187]
MISEKYGADGLPEDTISLTFQGSAGQSFGAFAPKGMTLFVEGDANDYLGKGLSGGKLIVKPDAKTPITAEDSAIAGNVTLYGATGGEAYLHGKAGARFAVRNSGAKTVVEGIGDNGCEYMTGGTVVVLGEIGLNFAAGMSGGTAYLYTQHEAETRRKINTELVSVRGVSSAREQAELREMLQKHAGYTGSKTAKRILAHFEQELANFVFLIPHEYEAMLTKIAENESKGVSKRDAELAAFYEMTGQKVGQAAR